MKQEMLKTFDEVVKEFENVETYILIVGDGKMQMNALQGKCKKALGLAMADSPEVMEIVSDALKHAKVQIKIEELLAEAEKQGITLPRIDDETEAEVEAEEKE